MAESTGSGHWADETAAAVIALGRPPVLSTGISPSGEIHIGNLREVLTADAIHRALADRGVRARFNYVCDNFDPLRRVYPFLDPTEYSPRVGRPLSEIPCPCGSHASYGQHFLEPFLEALGRLRIEVEVELADRMYKSGRMTPYIVAALEARDRIASILQELTGKEPGEAWSPFQPLCPACGRINQARVTGFSAANRTVDYACGCGSSGTLPMAGGGKLTWRVDWPARWGALGVSVEPFGKDHATRGGSYDTGVRIAREVFGGEPPFPVPYEWISLKGRGDMSSSKGNVLSAGQALDLLPPDALRYMVLREKPQRTIVFDPGPGLLKLMDEIEQAASSQRADRALELSRVAGFRPAGVPFRHLVVVAQVAEYDPERAADILARSGYPAISTDVLAQRMGYARRWIESHADEDLRFEVARELPEAARTLTPDQRRFLGRLGRRLVEGMDGDAVHALVYELAKEFPSTRPAALFEALYLALLGRPRGPRAGWFVALLGAGFCASRFLEASSGDAEPKSAPG